MTRNKNFIVIILTEMVLVFANFLSLCKKTVKVMFFDKSLILKSMKSNFLGWNWNDINQILLLNSISIILLLFVLFLLSYFGFIFHIPIQKAYIFIGFIIIQVFLFLFNKKFFLLQNFSLFIIFGISIFLSSFFYDSSWDGRGYHQQAIILLSNGWNPVFEKINFDYINPSIWVEHYQKCAEILSSNFVLFFNDIEIGKVVNYLFAVSTFCLLFFTFNKFKSSKILINFLLSILIVLNPVSICQVRTYYCDFIVYYLFAGVLFAIILKEKNFISSKLFLFLCISQLSMLCNIKLGGIFYSTILILCYLVYSLIIKNYTNLKSILSIISVLIFLLLVSGINPYFSNIKQGHHPFYPLVGKDRIDIMSYNSPRSFQNKNSLYKLFMSTFSVTDNISYSREDKPKLKIPFSYMYDLSIGPETRIGAFGVYWSGILLLLIPFVILSKNSTKDEDRIYYFANTILWLSVLLNTESWWARYVPQFWIIPIFIIFWKSLNDEMCFGLKILQWLLIVLLFANSLMIEIDSLKKSINFKIVRKEFFKEVKDKNVDIYIKDSVEKETMLYKLKVLTKHLNEMDLKEYEKNIDTFKPIPYLPATTGVYRINEE